LKIILFLLIVQGTVVVERFLRGAPVLAPLLFANVSVLGLMVLLGPAEPGYGARQEDTLRQ
jgi:hypothetical protein